MDGKKAVSMLDLEYCKDKVLMGTERKSAAVYEGDFVWVRHAKMTYV